MPDRISIRIIVILWVRLGLHNLGRALRLPNRPVALFRSDAVIVFGRIPLVGWKVGPNWGQVRCPASGGAISGRFGSLMFSMSKFSMMPSDQIENSAWWRNILLFRFLPLFTWNLSTLSLLIYSSLSARPPSLPSRSTWPLLCSPNLSQRSYTMILILILSDAKYNFEISSVAMIHY